MSDRERHETATKPYMRSLWQWTCSCGAGRMGYQSRENAEQNATFHRDAKKKANGK